jgi:hypothetical protein
VTSPITLTRAPGAPPAPGVQRLTPIEELDYLLDRPWEPNLVLWETHTHGHLDRKVLAEAVTAALGTDSGARRRLAATPRWGRRLYWRPAPGPGDTAPGQAGLGDTGRDGPGAGLLTVASWRTPAELEALRQRLFAWPIALEEAVVRVILAVGPEYDAVIMQVHHTAFDGISSLRLLGAIAQAYRDRLGAPSGLHSVPNPPTQAQPSTPTSPATPSFPPTPRSPATPSSSATPISPDTSSSLATPSSPTTPTTSGTSAPHLQETTAVTPVPADPEAPQAAPRLVTRAQARSWPGTVTRIAPQAGGPDRPGYGFVLISDTVTRPAPAPGPGAPRPTVNDLLVAALCLTIDRWNAAHGRASGQISVTIPVNGRTADQRWQGDGNRSWLIRVVTSPARRASADALLTWVAAQTRAARERGRTGGTDALSRLLATAWAPMPVKRRTARLVRGLAAPVLTDTSLVSNLGVLPEPPTFDGSGTEPLWLAPPCPMPRGLSVGAVTVAGRLHLSVRYRLALMDEAAAEDFMACFQAAMTELARSAPPSGIDSRAPS